jgi:uncharacterized RDD family membrane protein YckC
MTCDYCGAQNPHSEERCPRCGRRALGPRTGELRVDGALATKLQAAPGIGIADTAPSNDLANAVQRKLFYERPNVIPFEDFVAPPAPRPARRQRTAGSKTQSRTDIPSKPVAKATRSGARRDPVPDTQGKLDFLPTATPKPRTLGTTVEASIYCEAPVATPLHRTLAAAADWSMVLIAYAMFLTSYRLFGGELVLSKLGLAVLVGALPVIALVYGLVFAVARSETAGMRWMHLEVVTFDGDRPEGKAWLWRYLASVLIHATGIGLLWTMVDEESLAMQDHISSTFPTPRESNCQVFLQR